MFSQIFNAVTRLSVPIKELNDLGCEAQGKANGKNTNPFYQVEETPAPIISQKATITSPQLKPTFLYDLPTQAGKTYTIASIP